MKTLLHSNWFKYSLSAKKVQVKKPRDEKFIYT